MINYNLLGVWILIVVVLLVLLIKAWRRIGILRGDIRVYESDQPHICAGYILWRGSAYVRRTDMEAAIVNVKRTAMRAKIELNLHNAKAALNPDMEKAIRKATSGKRSQ